MTTRFAQVSGLFYDDNPSRLAQQVDTLLADAAHTLTRTGRAPVFSPMALVPHAGHIYCGQVIAATLARMCPPERVIMLCPNHTGRGAGQGAGQRTGQGENHAEGHGLGLSVWPDGAWCTPLGAVPVDTELAAALLAADGGYRAEYEPHAAEHAIEVLLPFVQRWAPQAHIVPIVVYAPPQALPVAADALARTLRTVQQGTGATAAGKRVSVLISSDMHHFGDERTTRRLDALALEQILALDPAGLWNTVTRERISMCGVAPAVLGLCAAPALGVQRAELVTHTTSAKVSGDFSRVVGYAGCLFLGEFPRVTSCEYGEMMEHVLI